MGIELLGCPISHGPWAKLCLTTVNELHELAGDALIVCIM
jgi:hypothetical protein